MQHIIDNNSEYVEKLGQFVVDCAKKAIENHGFFSIAFSGGSAATKICAAFENEKFSNATDFSKWKVLFCDERYVELSDPDSNFKAINDGLLMKHGGIDSANVIALKKSGDIAKDAADYESKMRSLFGDKEYPMIDLVVLGMGPDGHICSLFPEHALLNEKKKWIAFLEDSPKPPPQRITFTLGVVNNASTVIFITTGEGKAENVKKAIEGESSQNVPASLVKPVNGDLHWFMDTGAASLLKNSS